MSNIKKILILVFALMPGLALADSEQPVDPPRQAAIFANEPSVGLDLSSMLPLAFLKKQELPKPTVPTPLPAPIIYEVQEGDTLTGVAESHGTTWTRVYDANKEVEDPNLIQPGDKLRIPRPDEQLAARPLPTSPAPAEQSAAPTQQSELIGSYGYSLAGGNCVDTARRYGKNQPGNPISWVPTTQTPAIGEAALFYFNHVAIVVGIHSDGSIEVIHENCPGCPSRYPRSAIRGFF